MYYRILIGFLLITYSIFSSDQSSAQQAVPVSGKSYIEHTVVKSETLFSICQKYKVSHQQIIDANPGMSSFLKAGTKVKIPVKTIEATPVTIEKNPVKRSAEEFYYHKVTASQTIYSITKQYHISEKELMDHNPALTNGLKSGQVLKIPVHPIASNEIDNSKVLNGKDSENKPELITHQVVSGETLFSLEKQYAISHEEMLKYNPSLQDGLKAGMMLKIPVTFSSKNDESKSDSPSPNLPIALKGNCLPIKDGNNIKFKAALLLPFNLKENDHLNKIGANNSSFLSQIKVNTAILTKLGDTTNLVGSTNIDPKVEGFIEFYEGALLAIDSLKEMGMKIELLVFDCSDNLLIDEILRLKEMKEVNLIIGPVYPEFQELVSNFAAENHIPMVSPLSTNGNFEMTNPWYIKVNPTRNYQIDQSLNYIVDEFTNKNFILLHIVENSNSTEAKLGELIKNKLSVRSSKLFHEYDFQHKGINSIKPLLDESGENIFFIPTDNEAQASLAITNLNGLAENYNIVLMATPTISKMKSIQTENFHKVRLRYLNPYFIDYSKPLVRRFISHYRETFYGEPTQFSHQGFDLTYYFLSAMFRYGADFKNCLADYSMELTQMNFHFMKVNGGEGLMNQSLFISAYERNFDILNFGTYSTPHQY
jgi:LysM repeat protein/ABC-type branched-subunit amino acid transport system substrate-binding protein